MGKISDFGFRISDFFRFKVTMIYLKLELNHLYNIQSKIIVLVN